ncbi:uncharacterized protein LTR77_004398 [Saxophila tyrrhenica]|uniref:RING-type domain-containing protein n=1 Tax=Saxophila tyrrhenica TaxID=1690608 RepID=A0AAV9PCV1_9PEZI|nr:hypothetical protein LTR77_004398 [Saxophila tyrrhenica]
MATFEGLTITRSDFFDNIDRIRRPSSLDSKSTCPGPCGRPMVRQAPNNLIETAIILHGEHVVGEDCAKEYLETQNTCPECKVILFVEEPGTDDRVNLLRIWNLQLLQLRYSENGNEAMRGKLHDMWQDFIDARAELFLAGGMDAPKAEYGVYREQARCPSRNTLRGWRTVDAEVLVSQLIRVFDTLFVEFSYPVTQKPRTDSLVAGAGHDDDKLKVSCHPLAAKLREQMISTLWEYDDCTVPAFRIRHQFNSVWPE